MRIMKVFGIVIGICALGLIVTEVFAMSTTDNIESYKYKVVKEYYSFEIRLYEEAKFSYVTMPYDSYKESSGKGFRILAGYIFGGNETREEIAMTSPVEMELKDSVTMKFMVPYKYSLDELPKPDNSSIQFKTEPEKYLAAIRFGGWADDKKIEEHKDALKKLLEKNNIKHFNNFSFLGYNPPFRMTNRRNEVVVEIDKNSLNGI